MSEMKVTELVIRKGGDFEKIRNEARCVRCGEVPGVTALEDVVTEEVVYRITCCGRTQRNTDPSRLLAEWTGIMKRIQVQKEIVTRREGNGSLGVLLVHPERSNLGTRFTEQVRLNLDTASCLGTAAAIARWVGRGHLLYIEPETDMRLKGIGRAPHAPWSRHGVAIIDGLVHDPWVPGPPQEIEPFLKAAFEGQELFIQAFPADTQMEEIMALAARRRAVKAAALKEEGDKAIEAERRRRALKEQR